jgi:hypothetical protein
LCCDFTVSGQGAQCEICEDSQIECSLDNCLKSSLLKIRPISLELAISYDTWVITGLFQNIRIRAFAKRFNIARAVIHLTRLISMHGMLLYLHSITTEYMTRDIKYTSRELLIHIWQCIGKHDYLMYAYTVIKYLNIFICYDTKCALALATNELPTYPLRSTSVVIK